MSKYYLTNDQICSTMITVGDWLNGVKKGGGTRMKSTGVVRKVDELGRIVLPIEIRKILDIKQKDAIEIFTEGDTIVLRKYEPACIFCNNANDVIYFNGKRVCASCIRSLKEQI